MEKTKIEELKNILSTQEKWIKVHAAEFLIWEDHEVDFVKDVYLKEQKVYDTVPQYRIGIWRVLHQASTSAEDKNVYLKKIMSAFQSGPDTLHALETLAKLKEPVTSIKPQFADQLFSTDEITAFEIYGLWNLYHDPKIDKAKVTGRLFAILKDPKQTDLNKTIVSYVLRFIEIPKVEQEKILQVDSDSLSKTVQLQFLASVLINFELEGQKYEVYKEKLLSLAQEPNYYPAALLALAAKGRPENATEIEKYASLLSDSSSVAYSPDNHATASYAWLKYHRLVKK